MKYQIKFYTIIIFFIISFCFKSIANDSIKIGLVIPLSGEHKELGQSILKSVRLAINDINDNRIEIVPRDNQNSPDQTLEVSKELYNQGAKIIIGPIFKKNTLKLNQLNNVTFNSYTYGSSSFNCKSYCFLKPSKLKIHICPKVTSYIFIVIPI